MTWNLSMVHRLEITRWGPTQRAQFESFSSICGLPGFAFAGQIISRLGNLAGMRVGSLSSVVYYMLLGGARKGRDFFMVQPAGLFMMANYTAMSALTMVEGTAAGLAQGELQGAIASLQTVCQMFAPKFWSWVYEIGSKRGQPGLFYFGLAGMSMLKIVLSFVVGLDGPETVLTKSRPASEGVN